MLRRLVMIGAAVALCGRAAGGSQDLRDLLEGVESIGTPGIPGPLSLHGDAAFPVIVGRVGKNIYAPAAAAARAGGGRVVAFGKDGYLSPEGLASFDSGRFVCNAAMWVAKKKDPARILVAVRGIPGLADYLAGRGFKVCELEGKAWVRRLIQAHALCVNSHILDEAEIEPVRDFIKAGGGLLIEGLGWGWLELNPGKDLARDHPANRLLSGVGIAWTDGYLEAQGGKGFPARPQPPLLTHAGRALSALASPNGPRRPSDRSAAQAGWILAAAIRSLPPSDPVFLPRARHILEKQPPAPLPSRENPLRLEQGMARARVALELKDCEGLKAEDVMAHRGAAYFPGPVPAGAKRVGKTLRIDAAAPGWQSTGLYASAGETITVKMPARAAGKGLKLRIGAHTDDLWGNFSWARYPRISAAFPLTRRLTRAASPFGGLVYIENSRQGERASAKADPVSLRITGAVVAPYYVHGESSAREWQKTRMQAAPWAELASDRIVLTVPSEKARKLEDPYELMELWNRIMDAFDELAGRNSRGRRPERIVSDIQISAGYMHAGYPIMTHLDGADFMLDAEELRKGSWGLFHEIGHNYQAEEWTFGGAEEVTCNLFTLFLYERICGQRLGTDERDHFKRYLPERAERAFRKHLAGGARFEKWKADPFLALLMYVQLKQAFGWEPFKRVFAEYLNLPGDAKPRTDGEKRDQWLVRFSRAVGRNLGIFFEAWGVPTSTAARESIADLPVWLPDSMPRETRRRRP